MTVMSSSPAAPCAVVPVKLLAQTKQRLSALLSPAERQAFACAMLMDVLAALTRSSLDGVVVITADARAAAIARDAGVAVLPDRENAGIAAAASQAAREFAASRRASMLVLPADIPLITPDDVTRVIEAHGGTPAITLVAARDGGTNAIASSPPDAVPFCFGDASFRAHCDAARMRGIEPRVIELERVAFDIDRPQDLLDFAAQPSATSSYAWLAKTDVLQRVRSSARSQVSAA
jgi:2-phospho-L-lactate guanylyltransferase